MADKKEIVLQKCKNAIDCGEPITDYGFYHEVIALLKEQEAIKPKIDAFGHPYCPKCKILVYETWEFCPHCGRELIWNE